jgi:putative PIN family toxin of toxin-antitoxin system
MRVILDTNVLVSTLLSERTAPARVILHWRQGRFTVLTCEEQFDEIRRVTRYPKIRTRILPALAGRMVNELRSTAETVSDLPDITISRDPWDNFLLALAEKGAADFLVTGDKADLLTLGQHRKTTIVTARQFLDRL